MKETKKFEKQKYVMISLTLFLMVSIGFGVFFYNEANKWKKRAADENMEPWRTLAITASVYEDEEDLESAIKFWHSYNRGLLQFAIGGTIYPEFQDPFSGMFFLLDRYDSFVRDIAEGRFEGEEQELALQLFEEMNDSLLEICRYVLEHTESQSEIVEFMNQKSDLYKEVEKKNQEFCEIYYQKVQEFYETIKENK